MVFPILYDSLNRLSTVSEDNATAATYTYDTNGNRSSLTYANGTSETYTYNLANWITGLTNTGSNGTISSYSYTYYASGNQKTKTDETNTVTSYTYDGLGRLTQESETGGKTYSYTYDRSGNRTQLAVTGTETYTTSYVYDQANRLTTETKTQSGVSTVTLYVYDANGNLLSEVCNQSVLGFQYNARNQLTSAAVNGVTTGVYTYNADGIRTAKLTTEGVTYFLLDGGYVVGETTASTVKATYLYGANLIRRDAGTDTDYYLYNAHGDIVNLADGTGVSTKSYKYDAFGNEDSPVDTDPNPFRYCAEYFDKETGTYYLRARYYDPTTGRFTQQDPILDGANWYSYCGGNPINYEDPLGLERIVVSGGHYDSNGKYQYPFIDSALREVASYKGDEKTTLLVADIGLTERDRKELLEYGEKLNCGIIFFSDVEELNNYINNASDNNRMDDPITSFVVFSHGYIGSIEFGHGFNLPAADKEKLSWTIEKIKSLNPEAFNKTTSFFYSCNTGTEVKGTSFAQEWSNITGGKTTAARGQTSYKLINARLKREVFNWAISYIDRLLCGGYNAPYPAIRKPGLADDAEWITFFPKK